MERLTKYITPVGKCMTTLNSMKHYMPCVPCRHKAEIKTDSKGNMYTEKFSFCDTCEVKMLFNKLKEYEDAEEQGLLLRLPAPLDGVESFKIVDKGIWLNVPCQIGDTVYVICECETIPPQLDGTLYGENGEPGTATGYYCPYEENCPHVGKACEDDFDCDKFKGKPAVFEDSVIAVWHDESGVSIITSNCPINSRLGEYVFFTKEEAEQALARMEEGNG